MGALVSAAQVAPNGEPAAALEQAGFELLVERHWRVVYQACFKLVGDSWSAEDAAQETFLRAFLALPRFQGGNVVGWLVRIARNACFDELRRRRRRPVASRLPQIGEIAAIPDSAAGPEVIVQSAEQAAELLAFVRELPPAQQQTVLLVDLHGYSYEEAAEVLNVALGTVKSRLHRAHHRLRERLVDAA